MLRAGLTRCLDGFHHRAVPWPRPIIAARPGAPARSLAADVGMAPGAFKRQVRKLKELGLTESLEVGYRLSPRGQTLAERLWSSQLGSNG